MLAWVVEGARQWYAADRVMPDLPEQVQADTDGWRVESDLVLGFVSEYLVAEPGSHVSTSEVLDILNMWLQQRGHRPWSSQLLTSRFDGHGTAKVRPTKAVTVSWWNHSADPDAPARPWLFQGYRWRMKGEPG